MWTVYDVFTGQPAMVEDRIMMAMDMQDARRRAKLDVTGLGH
jgi:hypothetical protein